MKQLFRLPAIVALAVAIHAAVLVALFREEPNAGTIEEGVGGLEIGMGLAGGVPGLAGDAAPGAEADEALPDGAAAAASDEIEVAPAPQADTAGPDVTEMAEVGEVEPADADEATATMRDEADLVEAEDDARAEAAELPIRDLADAKISAVQPPPPAEAPLETAEVAPATDVPPAETRRADLREQIRPLPSDLVVSRREALPVTAAPSPPPALAEPSPPVSASVTETAGPLPRETVPELAPAPESVAVAASPVPAAAKVAEAPSPATAQAEEVTPPLRQLDAHPVPATPARSAAVAALPEINRAITPSVDLQAVETVEIEQYDEDGVPITSAMPMARPKRIEEAAIAARRATEAAAERRRAAAAAERARQRRAAEAARARQRRAATTAAEAKAPSKKNARRPAPPASPAGTAGASAGTGGGDGAETAGNAGAGQTASRGSAAGGLLDYTHLVTQQLARAKRYPRAAKRRRQEGRGMLRITVAATGQVLSHSLTGSTGHRLLDKEITDLLRRAMPLPPFPADLDRQTVTLVVPVDFRLR